MLFASADLFVGMHARNFPLSFRAGAPYAVPSTTSGKARPSSLTVSNVSTNAPRYEATPLPTQADLLAEAFPGTTPELSVDAVVKGFPFFTSCHRVLALSLAICFCLLERASLAPFIHLRLARTRGRWIVRGRGVRASHDQSRTGDHGPFHVRAPAVVLVPGSVLPRHGGRA